MATDWKAEPPYGWTWESCHSPAGVLPASDSSCPQTWKKSTKERRNRDYSRKLLHAVRLEETEAGRHIGESRSVQMRCARKA